MSFYLSAHLARTIRQATAREVRLAAEVMEPVEAATAKTPLIVKRSP